jgi:hypothetical protein
LPQTARAGSRGSSVTAVDAEAAQEQDIAALEQYGAATAATAGTTGLRDFLLWAITVAAVGFDRTGYRYCSTRRYLNRTGASASGPAASLIAAVARAAATAAAAAAYRNDCRAAADSTAATTVGSEKFSGSASAASAANGIAGTTAATRRYIICDVLPLTATTGAIAFAATAANKTLPSAASAAWARATANIEVCRTTRDIDGRGDQSVTHYDQNRYEFEIRFGAEVRAGEVDAAQAENCSSWRTPLALYEDAGDRRALIITAGAACQGGTVFQRHRTA